MVKNTPRVFFRFIFINICFCYLSLVEKKMVLVMIVILTCRDVFCCNELSIWFLFRFFMVMLPFPPISLHINTSQIARNIDTPCVFTTVGLPSTRFPNPLLSHKHVRNGWLLATGSEWDRLRKWIQYRPSVDRDGHEIGGGRDREESGWTKGERWSFLKDPLKRLLKGWQSPPVDWWMVKLKLNCTFNRAMSALLRLPYLCFSIS